MFIDGHSIAFRAFYALPPEMQTSSGQRTNAVFGFVSMVLKAASEYRPDRIVVVFDPVGKTFREEEFAEYKAQRSETPEAFREQEPLIREAVDALGLPLIEVEGYEADDVIATLAAHAQEAGDEVLVVTGDRDSLQLVQDPSVKVIYNRRGISDVVTFDEAAVQERYGIASAQYVDYAAMRGDASDNIPGVPGVGEKTAAKLLRRYGSIDGIYEHIDELTPKLREALKEKREVVEANRGLMRLRTDVPLPVDLDEIVQHPPDPDELEELFSALEFRTLLPRVREAFGARTPPGDSQKSLEGGFTIVDQEAFAELVERLVLEGGRVSVSVSAEGGGRSGTRQRSAYLAVSQGEECRVVRIEGITDPWERPDDKSPALEATKRLLGAEGVVKDGHDLVGTARTLGHAELGGVGVDTAVAAYLLNPGAFAAPNLARILEEHAGVSLGEAQQTLQVTADERCAAADSRAVAAVAPRLHKKLEDAGMLALYDEIERPLIGILASMEATGIKLDAEYLSELSESYGFDARRHEAEVKRLAGEDVNVRSTQQLAGVLFEKLKLTPVKSTKTGYSTDAATLDALRDEHPIIEEILAFRELERLRTIVEGLVALVEADGRVHPHYNQTSAATGRLSSENPNVQNVPVRTSLGRQIRKAFVADQDCLLITADYSQIELRVMAHMSGDEALKKALLEAHDVHSETAALVFGVSPEEVTEEMRRAAKMVNYGLSYGLETYGLAQRLGIENEEAQHIVSRYFESFPGVKNFMEEVVAKAKETGYTETIFGRRRYIPQLQNRSYQVRRMGERMAMNAPIQGTAADIIKVAMVGLEGELRSEGMEARQILQVHDEIVVEAPKAEAKDGARVLREAMTKAVDLAVPLDVEVGAGSNWEEAKNASGV